MKIESAAITAQFLATPPGAIVDAGTDVVKLPNAWHAYTPKILARTEAIKLTGTVTARNNDDPNMPGMPGPVDYYKMGMIQVIAKMPTNVAFYGKRALRTTMNSGILDTDSRSKPWYDKTHSCSNLRHGEPARAFVQDRPAQNLHLFYKDDTPLTSYRRSQSFTV